MKVLLRRYVVPGSILLCLLCSAGPLGAQQPVISEELFGRRAEAGYGIYWYGDDTGKWRAGGFIAGLPYEIFLFDRHDQSAHQTLELTAQPGETIDLGDIVLEKR